MNRLNLRPAPPKRPLGPLLAAVAAAGAVLLMLIISVSATHEHHRLAARAARLATEADQLETQAAALRPVVRRAELARAELARLRARAVGASALAQLETLVPADVWVTALTLRADTVELSGGALRWESVHRMLGAMRGAGMAPVLKWVSREEGVSQIYRFAVAAGLAHPRARAP